ncbi:MAG: RIP metalloprotease RseP, partial [Deltaproteobacteria bacterium]|nr:RIP metalloprotease RseP [Deltaproteobacteria bacterium]
MLLTLAAFVVLLLILIFVHELGHFLAAKLLGVRVERFSLGFPPRILSRRIGETEYQICWLPLGGYVKLFGEEPGSTIPPGEERFSFTHKPLWVKALVVFAGPLFNLAFAFLALWVLIMAIGFQHLPPVLGQLPQDGPAYAAGLRPGDLVVSLDGQEVRYFDQLEDLVDQGGDRVAVVGAIRSGQSLSFEVMTTLRAGRDILGDSSPYWSLGLRPRARPIIGQALPGKPASEAGIKPGDLVTAIDGRAIEDWSELVEAVQGPEGARATETGTPVRPMEFEVLRDGARLSFTITPRLEASQNLEGKTLFTPMVGLAHRPELVIERVGPIRAIGYSLSESWNAVRLTYLTIYKLIRAKISPKVMGGPILIAEAAGSKIRDGLGD